MKTTGLSFFTQSILRVLVATLYLAVTVRAAFPIGNDEPVRLALVIGNSRYESITPLKNPRDDERLIGSTLKKLGFDVYQAQDVSIDEFRELVADFKQKVRNADEVVFYYAGHGFQYEGDNYLVPVDARLKDRNNFKIETFALNDIIKKLQSSSRQTLIFLDACSNNPMPNSNGVKQTEGLTQIRNSMAGLYIAFATQPGNVTQDGVYRNSPFARALAEHMPAPGIGVNDMMMRVRNAVDDETGGTQIPWEQGSLKKPVYFNPSDEESDLSEEDIAFIRTLPEATRKKFLQRFAGLFPQEEQRASGQVETELASVDGEPAVQAQDADSNGDIETLTEVPTQSAKEDRQLAEVGDGVTAATEDAATTIDPSAAKTRIAVVDQAAGTGVDNTTLVQVAGETEDKKRAQAFEEPSTTDAAPAVSDQPAFTDQETAAAEEEGLIIGGAEDPTTGTRLQTRPVERSEENKQVNAATTSADIVSEAYDQIKPAETETNPVVEDNDPKMSSPTTAVARKEIPGAKIVADETETPVLELGGKTEITAVAANERVTETAASLSPTDESGINVTSKELQDRAKNESKIMMEKPVDAEKTAPENAKETETAAAIDDVAKPITTADSSERDNEITGLVPVESANAKPKADTLPITNPSSIRPNADNSLLSGKRNEASLEMASVDLPATQPELKPGMQVAPADGVTAEDDEEEPLRDYTTEIQQELHRLKCFRSTVDGKWGKKSDSALIRYFKESGRDPMFERDDGLLSSLRSDTTTSCPDINVASPPPASNIKKPAKQTKVQKPTKQANVQKPAPVAKKEIKLGGGVSF